MNRKMKDKQIERAQEASRRSRLLPAMLAMVLMLTLTGCASFATTPNVTSPGVTTADETTSVETTTNETTNGKNTNTTTSSTKTSDPAESDGTNGMGSTERNFTLTDVNGLSFTLNQTVGKKVYIKFWATWCPICLSGLSDLEQFNKDKSTDTDVVVLTIVSPEAKGEMSREDFIAWYDKQGYTFPVLLDDGGQIARLYEVRGYPTSVFIDTTGKIVRSQPGHIAGAEIDILLDSIM